MVGLVLGSTSNTPDSSTMASSDAGALKPVSAFANIRNRNERSAAYFVEAGRVLQHPRCLNCHPKERMPTQGDDLHAHVPMMQADANRSRCAGAPVQYLPSTGERCRPSLPSLASMPGHPHWGSRPHRWRGKGASLPEICEQVKDPDAQRRALARRDSRAHGERFPGRLGLAAGRRPHARARHAAAVR